MTVLPRMAMMPMVGTIAYLALGAIAPDTRIIAGALVTISSAIIALFMRGNVNPGEREERGNRRVITAFGLLRLPVIS